MNYWQGRHVLITGGAGFIGASLALALAQRGARVVVLFRNRKSSSALGVLHGTELVTSAFGQVTEQPMLEQLLASERISDVFHLAAESLVGAALDSPTNTFESNIRGTWSLLEACRRVGVKSIVVASSDKAYGDHERLPYLETFQLAAQAPYEVSKACADMIAQSYAHTYELPIGVTRCANTYGPGDTNWERLVPGTIRSLLEGNTPVLRSDGTMARDYLFIDDAIAGYLALGQAVAARSELSGAAFNFGTGKAVSVRDMVRWIAASAGQPDFVPQVLAGARTNLEIRRQSLSSDKARGLLGWSPKVSLQDGLQRTLAWYREHLHRAAHAPRLVATRPAPASEDRPCEN
jgi:CDP-glucose 4,6-dehydratase